MGTLYVVATPIGNLEDITIRAIKTLMTVSVIACEDTRRTGQLVGLIEDKYLNLLSLKINKPKTFISARDWNEANQVNRILTELIVNDIALVSDAGTPLLSDPGFKIVRAAIEAGHKVIPIPGPFAGAAAISASGLPTNKVVFHGFIGKNLKLEKEATHIIYESPKRLAKTMEYLKNTYPDSKIIIAREITKIHEYIGQDDGKTLKGEVVVLVYLP